MKTATQNLICYCLLLLSLFSLSSCKKEKRYTVSGKMMDFCGGAALSNHQLNVSYHRDYSWFSSYQNIESAGSGTTDGNGNFEFSIHKEYNNGEWTLTDKTSGKEYHFDLSTATKTKLTLGVIYLDSVQYKAEVNVTLTNKINATDTLYLSAGGAVKTIFPVVEKSYKVNFAFTKSQSMGTKLPNNTFTDKIHWSVGYRNFKQVDSMRMSEIKFNPCHFPIAQNKLTISQ